MIKRFSTMLLVTTLAACTNNAGSGETEEDSSVTETETPAPALSQQLSAAFPSLFRYFREQDNRFSPEKFEEATTRPIDTTAAQPVEEDQLAPYYPYLVYNGDSTYAIDLYSYNYVITTRNNKPVVEEGGPDTEVAIIDLKAKTRKRVFFGGTSTAVYDAAWINNKTFFLATGEMITSQSADNYGVQPDILLYDLAQSQVKHLIYPDTLQVGKGQGYSDNRLPKE